MDVKQFSNRVNSDLMINWLQRLVLYETKAVSVLLIICTIVPCLRKCIITCPCHMIETVNNHGTILFHQ